MLFPVTIGDEVPEADLGSPPVITLTRAEIEEWLVLESPINPASQEIRVPQFRPARGGEVFRVPLFPYLLPADPGISVFFSIGLGAHLAAGALGVAAGAGRTIKRLHIVRATPAVEADGRVRVLLGMAVRTR